MKLASGVFVAGLAAAVMAAAPGFTSAASQSGADVWGKDYFPEVELTNHRGEKRRFFEDLIEGKVVMINFIYTTCPDACPLETAKLLEVQRILGDRVGDDVFMYSITIDPEIDTVEVLADYASRFQVSPGWEFLTGNEDDIIQIRRKLGLFQEDIQGDDKDHNLNLIIGNQATGRWMKRSPFENSYILASQVGRWLHNWKEGPREELDYSLAPELRKISQGEQLFRTRCAACHTIGDPMVTNMTIVGPNLVGVTERRESKWLVRWLGEPDKMIEEGDPIALSLLEEYKIPMPNLQLNRTDIEYLLEYIDAEGARVSDQRIAREVADSVTPEGHVPDGSCCMNKKPFELSDEDFQPLVNDLLDEAEAMEIAEQREPRIASTPLVAGLACGALALASAALRRKNQGPAAS